jgi:hypothetical protein
MNSGAQATVAEARHPFRNLQLAYYLLTREFTPLWLFELLRGKRDLLSIRADLRKTPDAEFDVVALQGKLRQTLDASEQGGRLQWRAVPAGLGLATRGEPDRSVVQRTTDFLNTYGPYVERLSVRKRSPNVIAFFRLNGMEAKSSADFIRALNELLKG